MRVFLSGTLSPWTTGLKRAALALFVAGALVSVNCANAAVTGTWNVDAAGNWNAIDTWDIAPAYPNAVDDVANLTNDITAARIVTIPAVTVTIGQLAIGDADGSHGFTLARTTTGALAFDVGSGNALISKSNIGASSDTISTVIALSDNLDINNSATGSLTLSGVISGSGTSININPAASSGKVLLSGANTFTGGVTLSSGTLGIGSATSFGTGTLTLAGGALKGGAASTATVANTVNVTGNTLFVPRRFDDPALGNVCNVTLNGPLTSSGTPGAGPVLTFQHSDWNSSVTFGTTSDISGFKGTFQHDQRAHIASSTTSGYGTGVLFMGNTAAGMDGSQARFEINGPGGSPIGVTGSSFRLFDNTSAGISVVKLGELSGSGRIRMRPGTVPATLEIGHLGTSAVFSGNLYEDLSTTTATNVKSLRKVGTGSLTLSGDNDYSGQTIVSNGTLVVGANAGLATFNSYSSAWAVGITVADDDTLTTPSAHALVNGDRIMIAAGMETNSVDPATILGKPLYVGVVDATHFKLYADSALTTVQDFTAADTGLNICMPSALGATSSAIELGDGTGGAVNLLAGAANPTVTIARALHAAAGGGAPTFGSGVDGNSVFSGVITLDQSANLTSASLGGNALTVSGKVTGGNGLNKVGAGKAALSSALNDYTGPTTVKVGTLALLVPGSVAASPVIDVWSGATFDVSGVDGGQWTLAGAQTLKGKGTVVGSVLAASGSVIEPGESPGILTITGSMDMSAGANMVWELASLTDSATPGVPGTDYDQTTVSGTLTLGGMSKLTLNLSAVPAPDPLVSFWQTNHSWKVIDVGPSGSTSGNFAMLADGGPYTTAGSFSTLVDGSGDVYLNFTAVPEPSVLALLTMALAAVGVLRWRGRK